MKYKFFAEGAGESRHACLIAACDLLASSRLVLHVNEILPSQEVRSSKMGSGGSEKPPSEWFVCFKTFACSNLK